MYLNFIKVEFKPILEYSHLAEIVEHLILVSNLNKARIKVARINLAQPKPCSKQPLHDVQVWACINTMGGN